MRSNIDQFCHYTERGLRCVAAAGHIGKHDLQSRSSLSVRKIEAQEARDAEPILENYIPEDVIEAQAREHVTGETLTHALDEALEQPEEESSLPTETTESAPAPDSPAEKTQTQTKTESTSVDPADSSA